MMAGSSQRLKKLDEITLHINGEVIQRKENYKYLGACWMKIGHGKYFSLNCLRNGSSTCCFTSNSIPP